LSTGRQAQTGAALIFGGNDLDLINAPDENVGFIDWEI